MEQELSIRFTIIPNKNHLTQEDKSLFDAALKAREEAYAIYSGFLVGCALQLESGEIIKGSNQENAAYPSGLCAERTAIFWTSANYPTQKIKKIFVIGAPKEVLTQKPVPPCGACRQAILEYEVKQKEPIEIYFAAPEGEIYHIKAVRDLLPFSFDATFL